MFDIAVGILLLGMEKVNGPSLKLVIKKKTAKSFLHLFMIRITF